LFFIWQRCFYFSPQLIGDIISVGAVDLGGDGRHFFFALRIGFLLFSFGIFHCCFAFHFLLHWHFISRIFCKYGLNVLKEVTLFLLLLLEMELFTFPFTIESVTFLNYSPKPHIYHLPR